MSKLDLPTFSGPIEPAIINAWLGRCEDSYLVWSAWNPGHLMSPQLFITLAGLQLEEPSARLWWNQNRDVLKQLPTWEAFASRFQDRFIPSGWYLDALARFYNVSQDVDDFRTFVASLQAARNTLGSAGDGYTISGSIFKNHLFFFANPVLQLRVRAIPNFAYENLKVDALINIMETTWSSLVAEGFTAPVPKPILLKSTSTAARECPGDERRNIPPRAPRPIAAVTLPKVLIPHGDLGIADISNPRVGTITAILPPVVARPSHVFDDSDSDED